MALTRERLAEIVGQLRELETELQTAGDAHVARGGSVDLLGASWAIGDAVGIICDAYPKAAAIAAREAAPGCGDGDCIYCGKHAFPPGA